MAIVRVRDQHAAASGCQLTWAPELAEQLARGMPLTVLGQMALEPPLGRLLVVGRSEAGPQRAMSLVAVIVPAGHPGALALAPLGIGPLAGTLLPPPELPPRFPTRRTGTGLFVLDAEGLDQFALGPGVVLNQLIIACGSWPLVAPLFGPRVPARPIGDLASLQRDLEAFCAVVSATVDAIYERRGLPPPDRCSLVIRPTGLNVDAALEGLRWLGRTAAALAARLTDAAGSLPPPARRVTTAATLDDATAFAEVGGQEEAQRELQALCLAIREPDAYRRWGARPPKGILLFGPPGTGKTLLARCLARAVGAQFFHVRAADIASKWYGESERRMQQTFDRARSAAPAVIFFDEIDAIARDRDGAHEATHRVVSTLLENMDGLEGTEGVTVVAATNRPEAVDPALARPGRFDRLVEVPLPDRAGRQAVFAVHIRQAERQAMRDLFEPLDRAGWDQLLGATEGYSGAEIAEAVRRALEAKVRAGATEGQITLQELLEQAATVARPW